MWASDYVSDDGEYLGSETSRLLPAGGQLTDNWDAYPLHPAPNTKLYLPNTVIGQTPLSAAREGNTLWLDVTPYSDNQPGHLGPGLLAVPGVHRTGSYQVDENGKQVAAGNAVTAAARTPGDVPVQATLGADPGTVRFELTTSRTGPKFSLSTSSQTVWTWHSASVSGARCRPAGSARRRPSSGRCRPTARCSR